MQDIIGVFLIIQILSELSAFLSFKVSDILFILSVY